LLSGSESVNVPTAPLTHLKGHCLPVYARNLYWNWTRGGDVAIQPCPRESTGLARWTCDLTSLTFTALQPDMSDCKSEELSDLETRVREEDPENVIVSTLSRLTDKLELYGGDLEAVVNILKAVLNRLQYLLQTKADSLYNKESFLQEIFQNVLRSGSNLLKDSSRQAWMDLTRSRRIKVASNMVQTLEEHAFLLLNVLEQPETILESTKEIGKNISYYQFFF
jgi:latrophilin 1